MRPAMKSRVTRRCALAAVALAGVSLYGADYLTEGVDNGRTGWLKNEKTFNTANVRNMRLLWKTKADSTPRQMHNLFAPLVKEGVQTARGPMELAIFAGISDEIFAYDANHGELVWQRKFDSIYPQVTTGNGSTLCPGGQTAVPVIPTTPINGRTAMYTVSWDGRLHTLDVATGQDLAPPEKFAPPNAKPYALNLFNGGIYTSTAQGCGGTTNAFVAYNLATKRTAIFAPDGGGMWGRRGVAIDPEGRVYIGTGDATFDDATKSLGNAIVSVKMDANGELQLVDYYAPPNANWMFRRDLDVNVTPMVFDYQGRKFLVGTSKECRLWLLDRDNLGGRDHRTALYVSPLLCNDAQAFDGKGVWGAMAAWVDGQGRQWVIVPFYGPVSREFKAPREHMPRAVNGGVAAYTLEQRNGKWELVPQWLSRDIDMAEHAIVANGVLFVYGSGEDTTQVMPERAYSDPRGAQLGGAVSNGAPRRLEGRKASLYAFDALTGQELWNSGNEITTWNHFSGLTVANGRVFLSTFDGTIYAFGVPR
jgi:outer membrane protein assembly factor BamB